MTLLALLLALGLERVAQPLLHLREPHWFDRYYRWLGPLGARSGILLGGQVVLAALLPVLPVALVGAGLDAWTDLVWVPFAAVVLVASAVAAVVMAVLMAVLIGLGWSWGEARVVGGSVIVALLILLAVVGIWRLNFSPWAGTGQELSSRTTATVGQRLMARSLDTVAGARRESSDPVTLRVSGTLPPSMAWSLRRAPVEWLPSGASETPGIVLVPEEEYETRAPSLQAEYRGQSLATRASWGWAGLLPPGLLNWYFRAVAPIEFDRWVWGG